MTGSFRGPQTPERFLPADEDYGGVPLPTYLITFRGDVVRAVSTAREVREYLAARGFGWACLVNVNGKIREVCRNPLLSRGGTP